MKRIVVALTFLLATSSATSAQYTPSKENLRGLTGVRLIVMYGHCPTRDISNCAEGLDQAQRPEVLKMLEADATAKLQNAGIPVFGLADKRNERNAGDPKLTVMVTLGKLNGFNYGGVGQPLEIPTIQRLVANNLDQFIADYLSVNPKQAASSGNTKH